MKESLPTARMMKRNQSGRSLGLQSGEFETMEKTQQTQAEFANGCWGKLISVDSIHFHSSKLTRELLNTVFQQILQSRQVSGDGHRDRRVSQRQRDTLRASPNSVTTDLHKHTQFSLAFKAL